MTDFRIGNIPSNSILHMYSLREGIWFDPPYQRQGNIWSLETRQLLIDSIINGFDIPKLYFHEFFPSKDVNGKKYKYAIIDGKQRLNTIFSFIEGKFALSEDLMIISDPDLKAGGMTYVDLAKNFPDLKTRFDGYSLPIMAILTEDVDLIEDMFSRLNEAAPLNAAEKRNAFGGALPKIIRELAAHPFFVGKLPFDNKRYRHYDLAVKFLYWVQRGELVDTKKIHLDEFVRTYKAEPEVAAKLKETTEAVLDEMAKIFVDADVLLRSVGSVAIYYYLFFECLRSKWKEIPQRMGFAEFEKTREENRAAAESDVAKANFSLLEYDRLGQSPNDGTALRYRYAVLRQYMGPEEGRPPLLKDEA